MFSARQHSRNKPIVLVAVDISRYQSPAAAMTNITAELNLTSSVGNSTGRAEEWDREYYDLYIDSSEAAGPATSTSDTSLPLATIILIIVFIYSLLVLIFISGEVSWCC